MEKFKEPRSEIFEYGFLTSRTARILSRRFDGGQIDAESIQILSGARSFMDKVLDGEALASGERSNFSPSLDGLAAFNYGVKATIELKNRREVKKLDGREELRTFLRAIRDTLSSVVDQSQQTEGTNIEIASKFFAIIAHALIQQAKHYPLAKTVSL